MKNLKTKISYALYILLVAFLFTSCNPRMDKGEDVFTTNILEVQKIKQSITYIEDEKTGLCFAVLNNHTDGFRSTFTMACVPCDSLKNVTISK